MLPVASIHTFRLIRCGRFKGQAADRMLPFLILRMAMIIYWLAEPFMLASDETIMRDPTTDVILPVAGGLGAVTAQNSIASKKSKVIWVDTDGFVSANKYRSVLLTSVQKGLGESVKSVINDVAAGKFTNAAYVGTLKNGGTKLAPYHDLIRVVPSALRAEVTKLGTDIANGKVSVK